MNESELKRIEMIRGGQSKPIKVKDDKYDSIIHVYNPDAKIIHTVPYVNTDFTNGYKGGIIAEGANMAGVKYTRKSGYPAIAIFRREFLDKINSIKDLTYEMTVLDSLIPNPNHAGAYVIARALLHYGGYFSDLSRGCPTIHPDYAKRFFDLFRLDEVVLIDIIRYKDWPAPEFYQGK